MNCLLFILAQDLSPHPILSSNPGWLQYLARAIAILFISAAIIGPLARRRMPRELPTTHAHDEPPGTSGRHGPTGQIDSDMSSQPE